MKIARYFVVGGVCVLVDLAVFSVLIYGAEWHYLLAAPISFTVATYINYHLGIRHVFESGVRFFKYQEIGLVFLVSAVGLVINQISLYVLVEFFQINPVAGKIMATGVIFFWNYGARRYFIFAKRDS